MIITKGFGSKYIITQGYGGKFVVIISPTLFLLSGEIKIGKKFNQLVCTSDDLYLDLNGKLLLGFDGRLYLYLNEKIALEL